MPRFVVEGNVTFTVVVKVEVEADDAEEAEEKALRAGLLEEEAAEIVDMGNCYVEVFGVYQIG